jgi:hypothetical protein
MGAAHFRGPDVANERILHDPCPGNLNRIESRSGGGARPFITVALATNSPYLVRSFAGAKEVGVAFLPFG